MSFEIQVEAITQNMLTEKIVETIERMGKPKQIRYGRRVGTVTVWDTATMIYSTEQIKSVEEMTTENKALQEKLDIAVKALEIYADKAYWSESSVKLDIDGFGIKSKTLCVPNSYFGEIGYEDAQEALAKIKAIE